MNPISKSIPKIDHKEKADGTAKYVCDYPTAGMMFGRLVRSTVAKGIVNCVILPPLPDDYVYIDKDDIPGLNEVHMIQDDSPVFTDKPEYIGEPIGMIFGPDEAVVSQLLDKVKVEYTELDPIFDASLAEDVFFEVNIEKGDTDAAFDEADSIFEGIFETGLQEHVYLETNGMIAEYNDGKLLVHGSIQCPYYVQRALVQATSLPTESVTVRQDVTGGGFGGKEDFPSILACQVAVAAMKSPGRKIRIVFEREEDIIGTSKRHPSLCRYKAAVKDGKVTTMDVDVILNAGAYTTMSLVVLQRASIAGCGVYTIPNLKIRGRACKTNTVPNGAFRGFGGPQTFFAVEMLMSHIAKELGIDSVDFKLAHVAKQGDLTSTSGKYHFPVPIPEMARDIIRESDYYKKQELYKNQTGRYRKGIGFSLGFHGAGFTGNGERDIINAVAKLHKRSDDKVEILTANTDMGQGLLTAFTKIVACQLDLPIDRIIFDLPDTSRVPDSGPTVASRSVMVVGELLRRAAVRLRAEWISGKEQTITQCYEHPDFMIPFDSLNYKGDAYPTYSWAVSAVEIMIDTLTGYITVSDAWGCFDVGTPIDENIVIGQMEGGFVQSLAWGYMEKIEAHNGLIRNNNLSDYIIPTALDMPNIKTMLHVAEYPDGPFGAKGAGEMSHVGGGPAIIDAVQNALGIKISKLPFMPQDVLECFSCLEDGV